MHSDRVLQREIEWLAEQAASLSLNLQPVHLEQLSYLATALVSWNKRVNLTALTEWSDIVEKHFLDSLLILTTGKWPNADKVCKVCDVGTGAGFPGLVLAIVQPDTEFVLVDGTRKKLTFVQQIIDDLQLRHCRVVHGRAEELARRSEYREEFSVVVSRAVAALPLLLELCLPLTEVHGTFIAWKGPNVTEEMSPNISVYRPLGIQNMELVSRELPRSQARRTWVIVRKDRATTPRYPRPLGKMKKRPLF